jgi:hypothetical protein
VSGSLCTLGRDHQVLGYGAEEVAVSWGAISAFWAERYPGAWRLALGRGSCV